jgi:hypothetical protein
MPRATPSYVDGGSWKRASPFLVVVGVAVPTIERRQTKFPLPCEPLSARELAQWDRISRSSSSFRVRRSISSAVES